MFNTDQLLAIARTLGPPILTYLAGRYPDYAGVIGQLAAGLAAVGATGWSVAGHTTDAKIAAVELLDQVVKVQVKPTADMRPAINDPNRPKVVSQ